MNKKTSYSGKRLLGNLCLIVVLLVGLGNTAWAEELIVTSSTTKTYTANTPIAGNLLGSTLIKSEYIIPSSKITELKGKTITKMSLTLNAATSGWGEAEFQVFLKEVSNSQYPSPVVLIGNENATIVYEGQLDATKASIDINFTTTFDYSSEGKNLLVGVYCTKTGTAASVNFKLIRESTSDYNYYSAYTNNDSGSLTRTNWYPETTFTYQNADVSTPVLSVSTSSIAFGSVRANATQTVTVTNTGVGTMDVAIANNNTTDFTVSETSLTGIVAGESKTFTVTFNYNAASLGDKEASITVTPSYDATDAKTIAVTATAANANVWEDFSNGIPSTWYNENDYWLLTNGTANPGWGTTYALRTPRLYAEKNEEIGFDVILGGSSGSYWIQAEYSTDCTNWSLIEKYVGNNTTSGVKTFVAPETGYYWLRFYGSQSGVDNFYGWTVAENTHDVLISASSIPTTGTVHGTYTATATIVERGGSDENLTAELYFGNEKVAESAFSVGGNRNVTVSLSFTAEEEWEGLAHIKIYGENISTLETDPVEVSITETPYVLDENGNDTFTCSSQVVKVNYTAQKGWNTIVMPFSLSGKTEYMNNIFGNDWVAYAISGYDNGTLTFSKTTYLGVSVPYLVYAPNAETHESGVYLSAVSIQNYAWTYSNLNQTKGDATFKGTFAPIAAPGMNGKYGLTPNGQIMNGNENASIKAYRAYFEFAEGSVPAKFSIVIDENEAPTLIGAVQMMENNAGVYDLQGRRIETVNGQVVSGQLPKGIYIVNGKKVIVK